MDKSNFFLRNIWYYALPSDRLKPGRIVAKTLLNEPILFGRTNTGRVFALRDICPHRAVPLSCGRFDGKEVECAYHGWRFDAGGQCSAIPSLTDDQKLDLSRFRVKQYPVREIQGNIWIYMSRGDRAAVSEPEIEIPQVPEFGDRSYQAMEVQRFPCFVDRAVVGLMDPAHVPFVHRAWWWRSDAVLSEEVKAFSPSPYGFTMKRHRLERSTFFYNLIGKNPEVAISFQLPGIRIEQVITDNNTVCNLTAITPITEIETEVTTLFYTTLPWFALLKPLLLPFIQAFLNQDRQIVIKQQIGLQYDPPLMLIAISEGRPFSNPVKERVLRWRS